MELQDIYRFLEAVQPTVLCRETAVGYVVSVLLKSDSYVTELLQQLEKEYPGYCLSDTVLSNVIKFLESEQWVRSYHQKHEGPGRPRRMLRLNPAVRDEAQRLAQLWQDYAGSK